MSKVSTVQFTRGSQCIRIVREEDMGRWKLLVDGVAPDTMAQEFADVVACVRAQSELEQQLLANGYQLESKSP